MSFDTAVTAAPPPAGPQPKTRRRKPQFEPLGTNVRLLPADNAFVEGAATAAGKELAVFVREDIIAPWLRDRRAGGGGGPAATPLPPWAEALLARLDHKLATVAALVSDAIDEDDALPHVRAAGAPPAGEGGGA